MSNLLLIKLIGGFSYALQEHFEPFRKLKDPNRL